MVLGFLIIFCVTIDKNKILFYNVTIHRNKENKKCKN